MSWRGGAARSERSGGDGKVQHGYRGGKHVTAVSTRRESS
jgi:hypothetical protein